MDLINRPKNELDGEDKSQRRTLCAALYVSTIHLDWFVMKYANMDWKDAISHHGDLQS